MKRTKHIYRITAITMAFLMFFTSVGLSIDVHYCQGNIKSVSLFGKAKTCYQLIDANSSVKCQHSKPSKNTTTTCNLNKKDCCHNKTAQAVGEIGVLYSLVKVLEVEHLQQFLVPFSIWFLKNKYAFKESTSFKLYTPPLIPRDIPVLLESFLI